MIALQSVQSLLLQMRFNGQHLASGTGFVATTQSGPVLITNRHNVTGCHSDTGQPLSDTGGVPNEVMISHNSAAAECQWVTRIESLYGLDGQPRWAEHPVLKAKADFVALPLARMEGVKTYPYDPCNPGVDLSIGPADTISVIGFPFGRAAGGAFGIWATGFIASELAVDFEGLPVFLIDCRSRPGQSGSPVIAYRNGGLIAMANGNSAAFNGPICKFLGIYSGRINAQSDLGLVWKAAAIAELIRSL